jgi:hypothetical protein
MAKGSAFLNFCESGILSRFGNDWTNLKVYSEPLATVKLRTSPGLRIFYILTADCLDNIIWRGSEKLCNDGKLIDVILPWEEWLSLQHFRKDASSAPDIYLYIVFLPCQHNFRSTVVSCRDVTSHLWVLDTGETEITNLQVAVLVDENVGWFEISVNDTGRVDIFQATLRSTLATAFRFLSSIIFAQVRLTKIWYKKYWINCVSRGREVRRR